MKTQKDMIIDAITNMIVAEAEICQELGCIHVKECCHFTNWEPVYAEKRIKHNIPEGCTCVRRSDQMLNQRGSN